MSRSKRWGGACNVMVRRPPSSWRRAVTGVVVALASMTGIGSSALAPARSSGLRDASAPQVRAPTNNVQVTEGAGALSAEDTPSLAQDPVHSGYVVEVNRVDRPDFLAAVRYSTDGGHTWHPSALQAPPGSDYPGVLASVAHKLYAPRAVFDSKGTLYVSFVTLSGSGNQPDGLWIERSTDGGQSFLPPSSIAGAHTFAVDLAIDHSSGRLFATWLQTPAFLCVLCFPDTGYPIVVSHSDDHGTTWSAPMQVSDPGRARIGAPVLAVDAHGNPSVLYYDYEGDALDWGNLPGTYTGNFSLVLASSADRGSTFSPGRVVDSSIVPPHRFLVYLAPSPAFAIGHNGEMVAAWADGRSGASRVLLRYSTDGGASWQGPVVVSNDPADGGAQDLPAAAVAPDGRIEVLYYEANGSTSNIYLSSSGDGGGTFPTVTRVSTQSSDLQVGPQESPYYAQADFGTKIALVSSDSRAMAAWTDTRKGSVASGRQDIYLAAVGITPPPGKNGIIVIVVIVAAALGGAGVVLLLLARRRTRRSEDSSGPPRTGPDVPPPPPPLVPSPGQV